jgi:hypothetical protein
MEQQNVIKVACCVCGSLDNATSYNIIDNFVKFKADSFVPLAELIHQTLNFDVNFYTCITLELIK